jgi:hypothetical protein
MKLHTPDGNELMEVLRIEREGDHLVVRGTIMGTMPTKAVIRPEHLRAAFSLLSPKLLFDLVCLLFVKRSESSADNKSH